MLGQIKALVIILAANFISYKLLFDISLNFISRSEFRKWYYICITTYFIAFVANDYWLFNFIIIFYLLNKVPNKNRLIYYCLLLPLLPYLKAAIPGFGSSNLIYITYPRVILFSLLIPLTMSGGNKTKSIFSISSDKYIVLYLVMISSLEFRDVTFTAGMRTSFYFFIDYFIPYFAITRYITNIKEFYIICFSLLVPFVAISFLSIYEAVSSWHLLADLESIFDMKKSISSYKRRDGMLRASFSFQGSIVLGYMLMISIGLFASISGVIVKSRGMYIVIGVLICGLISSLSRGPWVGGVLLFIIFFITGREKIKLLQKLIFAVILIIPVVIFHPSGEKIINLIPFLDNSSDSAHSTIDYRERLFENSMIIIERYPYFGSTNYLKTKEMEELRQGEGIIDIVNSYLRIALNYGYIGLSAFILIYASLLIQLYKIIRKAKNSKDIYIISARGLFATMVSMLLVIGTVSSNGRIPILYFIFAGLIASYCELIKLRKNSVNFN